MDQERIFKEEVGKILYQRVHVVATTQELHHSPQNFVWLARDSLGTYKTLCQAMATWPIQIDRFKQKCDRALSGDRLFGLDIMDRIHK